MFEQATTPASPNSITDWILRAAVGAVFIVFGQEKFGSSWVEFFQRVGWSEWFRYFTGAVEILGGLLMFPPWTVTAGIALLASTMLWAPPIHIIEPNEAPALVAEIVAMAAGSTVPRLIIRSDMPTNQPGAPFTGQSAPSPGPQDRSRHDREGRPEVEDRDRDPSCSYPGRRELSREVLKSLFEAYEKGGEQAVADLVLKIRAERRLDGQPDDSR